MIENTIHIHRDTSTTEEYKDTQKKELVDLIHTKNVETYMARFPKIEEYVDVNKENNLKKFVQDVFETAFSLIKRADRDADRIEKDFGKRNIAQILQEENPNVCFMNPCFEFTMIIAEVMKRNNIPVKFIIGKHRNFVYGRLEIWLHFWIEIEYEHQKYFIDNISRNDIMIGKGDLITNNGKLEIFKKFSFEEKNTHLNQTIHQMIWAKTIEEFEAFINQWETDSADIFKISVQLERLKRFAKSEQYKDIYMNDFLQDQWVKTGRVNLIDTCNLDRE